jgi:peroxiredoxin Q/BCP
MGKELKAGDKSPDFSLTSDKGDKVNLKQFRGKRVVLYFYPKDNTPGCTRESCDFRDSIETIEKAGAVVLGVSLDDQASHQKFIKKYDLPFTLLCDTEDHEQGLRCLQRKTLTAGNSESNGPRHYRQGQEDRHVFRKVKVDNHRDEVLEALEA